MFRTHTAYSLQNTTDFVWQIQCSILGQTLKLEGGKDPCTLLSRLWPWPETWRRAKEQYTECFPKIISSHQTIWGLEPFWARHSLYVFNNNQDIYFSLICPAQHGAVQSFVFCSVLQPGMGEHFPEPHCSQRCWADRRAVSTVFTLFCYCETEI